MSYISRWQVFLLPAWGDRRGFVSRDGKQKDDMTRARWQKGEHDVRSGSRPGEEV
jgi:hypothetical protein